MGKIGYGYGSEWHLLRWMGRHRTELDQRILHTLGRAGAKLEWEDFPFAAESNNQDAEWKGLDFLNHDRALQRAWAEFWPNGSGIHNWDAVAWIKTEQGRELLLVEAKAHVGEIGSHCAARSKDGREKIEQAFRLSKHAIEVAETQDWINGYYQFANRLAALYFLHRHRIPAHLLLIYFTGDRRSPHHPGGAVRCPRSPTEWAPALAAQDKHIGLPAQHLLSSHIHKLFLPGASAGAHGKARHQHRRVRK